MQVEMECVAIFRMEPASAKGPEKDPWYAATIYVRVTDSAFGKFETVRNYSTRHFDTFMTDWGYIDEAASAAIAMKSGLYSEPVTITVNLTELGLRVNDRSFF